MSTESNNNLVFIPNDGYAILEEITECEESKVYIPDIDIERTNYVIGKIIAINNNRQLLYGNNNTQQNYYIFYIGDIVLVPKFSCIRFVYNNTEYFAIKVNEIICKIKK